MAKLENAFRNSKIVPWLKRVPHTTYFIKEALALRGIHDIIICINGRFATWEIKKSVGEARKQTGRIVLQHWFKDTIEKSNGLSEFVFPENLEDKKLQLLEYGFGSVKGSQLFDLLDR